MRYKIYVIAINDKGRVSHEVEMTGLGRLDDKEVEVVMEEMGNVDAQLRLVAKIEDFNNAAQMDVKEADPDIRMELAQDFDRIREGDPDA